MSIAPNSTTFEEAELCQLDRADSVWVGFSSVLVQIMTPAVGFIYAGLVHQGAMGSMLGLCFTTFAVVTIIWGTVGYSLVYGNSQGGFIGDFRYIMMSNLDNFKNKCIGQFGSVICLTRHYYWDQCGIPEILYLFFQAKFACITPVLILGAISERMYMKYSLLFISLWTIIIYCPVSHWVWNEMGFLHKLGVRDFAGGNVVHMSSGFSALITSIVLGKRKAYGSGPDVPNFPYVILGTMLLWFGWFGFVGGNSFRINRVGILAVVNMNVSASVSLFVWIVLDLIKYKRISALGIAMGSICGLVAITPGAGYVSPQYSYIYGFFAAIITWTACYLRKKYQLYDDLDVFTCHGLSGMWGVIATGLFADKRINSNLPYNGLVFAWRTPGESSLFIIYQLISIVVVPVYSVTMTFLILYTMKSFCTIRAKSDEEIYYDHVNFFDEVSENKNRKVEIIR